MLFDKVYVINLERNKDRLSKMFDKLKKANILGNIPIIVVKAHDGKKIDDEYLKIMKASVFPHWKDPWFGRAITTGEIGCALSHHSVWKEVADSEHYAENSHNRVLVLEDDVILSGDFSAKCEKIEKELGQIDYEFLYLGRKAIFPKEEEKISENILIPNHSFWTNGYVINSSGANKLCNTSYLQNIIPTDEYVSYLFGRPNKMISDKFDYVTNLRAYSTLVNIVNPEEGSFKESNTEKSEPYVSSTNEIREFGKKIHILTIATEKNDGLKLLQDSAKKYGVPIEILGLNNPKLDYLGGGQKVNLLKERLKNTNDEDIVLFTDSHDVIYNANINEIVGKFMKSGGAAKCLTLEL